MKKDEKLTDKEVEELTDEEVDILTEEALKNYVRIDFIEFMAKEKGVSVFQMICIMIESFIDQVLGNDYEKYRKYYEPKEELENEEETEDDLLQSVQAQQVRE